VSSQTFPWQRGKVLQNIPYNGTPLNPISCHVPLITTPNKGLGEKVHVLGKKMSSSIEIGNFFFKNKSLKY
jgi:hypothetical protein